MSEVSKRQFVNGAIWRIIEQFSTKGISLLVTIVLTRLITPSAYGLIALTAVFTNLSDILIDGGFSTALIRKKEVDDYDFSCVLIVSFSLAIILYTLIFLGAPAIASYYEEPRLVSILRIIGLILFIQAFSAVRTAIVNRNMQFKLLFRCNFTGAVISGIMGIIMACVGLDVWALVIQRLLQVTLSTIFLFSRMRWKMHFHFELKRIKTIFSFSLNVVVASLINYISGSLYNLVVGKKYSVVDLGYSDKGAQLPQQASLYTFGAMSSVLLPTLSSYQNDMDKFKRVVRKVFQMTNYLIAPMMVGLAMVSRELIVILFTDVWTPAAPIMQSYCLYYYATPLMLICVQVFFALGYSATRVKTEFIRMIMQVLAIIVVGVIFGGSINQLAFACAIVAVLSAVVAFAEVGKMIAYTLKEILSDMLKPIIASLVMALSIFMLDYLMQNVIYVYSNVILLLSKISIGVVVYLGLSILLKINGFQEVLGIVTERKKNE